jgi:hypothetical protein
LAGPAADAGRIPFPTITRHNSIVSANAGTFHSGLATGSGNVTILRVARQPSISLGYAYTVLRILWLWRWTGNPSSFSHRRTVAELRCK